MKQMDELSVRPSRETLDLFDSVAVEIKVLEVNSEGRLVYVGLNKTAFSRYGWAESDVIGKTPEQLAPGMVGQIAAKNQRDVIRDKEPRTFDIRVQYEDGHGNYRTTLIPTLNEQGEVFRIVATTIDVTAEQDAIDQRLAGERLVSDMENFTALAAHDLRTPMIHIASISEVFRRDVASLSKNQIMALQMLEKVGENALGLIKRVLERYRFVHLEYGGNQGFELARLCHELYSVLDPFGNSRLVVEERWLIADKVAIQVVITNLINNALKRNGGVSIDTFISVRPSLGADMLRISIRNTGKGFDDKTKNSLEQGGVESSDHFGLAGICGLIRSRKGEIFADNAADDGGATIEFTYPGRIARRGWGGTVMH